MNQPNTTYNMANVTPLPTQLTQGMKTGVVTALEGNTYVIDGSLNAQQALSCMLKPNLGDKVMYWSQGRSKSHTQGRTQDHSQSSQMEERWILAVLCSATENTDSREVSLPNNEAMKLNTQKLTVNANEQINLNTMGDINLNSVAGKLAMSAKRCYLTIQDSLIQMAKHMINRADYIDHQADKLLKTHASQHLMTADKDIKVDAERINMG